MHLHAGRAQRLADLRQLDPARDWHEIYKRVTLWELPAEARFGFQLAFYRPFAVPRMAAALQRTGHSCRDTSRRAYDTGLVMHEVISGGVDSDRGRHIVKLINLRNEQIRIFMSQAPLGHSVVTATIQPGGSQLLPAASS